jgi:hypothetical protein
MRPGRPQGVRWGRPGRLALGPGARGIVFGERASGPGHIFEGVVNKRGVVEFFDGQTMRPALLDGYAGFRLLTTAAR